MAMNEFDERFKTAATEFTDCLKDGGVNAVLITESKGDIQLVCMADITEDELKLLIMAAYKMVHENMGQSKEETVN